MSRYFLFLISLRRGMEPADKIETLNTMILNYKANDISYVDYYSAMVDDRKGLKFHLFEDGVHPIKEGYKQSEVS